MKHAFRIRPHDTEYLELDYTVELGRFEAKRLPKGVLAPNFDHISIGFRLCSLQAGKMVPWGNASLGIVPRIRTSWSLSSDFQARFFEPHDFREAYVLLRNIMHHVENAMILALPSAPFEGITQTFDTRVDIPREVADYSFMRRNIIAR